MTTTVFEAIGTRWQIDLPAGTPPAGANRALAAVRERIEAFDRVYSRFRPDSLVTQMARQPGDYTLPADAGPLLECYRQLYDLTDGAVTPLIGQLLTDAGYDSVYSFQERELKTPPVWDEVLVYRAPRLTLRRPALLDFGAAGKGYLVDLVGAVLAEHGLAAYVIDAGGDLLHRGPAASPLRVGLEHPDDPSQVIGVAEISNQSLCGSSGNRRAWGRFHHIIDPHQLASPTSIRAVWVAAPSALIADALATALFFAPAAVLAQHFTFEYLLVRDDYTPELSAGFPAKVFTA